MIIIKMGSHWVRLNIMGWVLVTVDPYIINARAGNIISSLNKRLFQLISSCLSPGVAGSRRHPPVALIAPSSSAANASQNTKRSLGIIANAKKREDIFITACLKYFFLFKNILK